MFVKGAYCYRIFVQDVFESAKMLQLHINDVMVKKLETVELYGYDFNKW